MSLSDNLGHDFEGEFIISDDKDIDNLLRKKDVKEFIKKLLEQVELMKFGVNRQVIRKEEMIYRIKREAGKELI